LALPDPVVGNPGHNRLGLAPLSDHLSGLRRRRVAQFYGSYHSKSNKYNRLAHKMHAQRFMTLCTLAAVDWTQVTPFKVEIFPVLLESLPRMVTYDYAVTHGPF